MTPWGEEFEIRTESGHFAFDDQFYYGSPQDIESPQDNDPKMQSQKKSNDSPCAKYFQGSLLLKRRSENFPMEERIGETLRRSNNKFITVGTPTPSEQFIEVARGIHEDSSYEIENKHMSFKPSKNDSALINKKIKELGQDPSKKNSPMTYSKSKQFGQDLQDSNHGPPGEVLQSFTVNDLRDHCCNTQPSEIYTTNSDFLYTRPLKAVTTEQTEYSQKKMDQLIFLSNRQGSFSQIKAIQVEYRKNLISELLHDQNDIINLDDIYFDYISIKRQSIVQSFIEFYKYVGL